MSDKERNNNPEDKDNLDSVGNTEKESSLEVEHLAQPSGLYIGQLFQLFQDASREFNDSLRGMDLEEKLDALDKYQRVLAIILATAPRIANIIDLESRDRILPEHKIDVLFIRDGEKVVGFGLVEVRPGVKKVTIPEDPKLGAFTTDEIREKYPPGSTVECSVTSISVVILPNYQGKGLGKELMSKSVGIIRGHGVSRYAESQSKDSAVINKWLQQEGYILDYCRIAEIVLDDPTTIAGVYLNITPEDVEVFVGDNDD